MATSRATVKLIRDLRQLPASWRGGALAIGNYDGVHLGHARIVKRLLELARHVGGPALVFTFDPPPARLLRPDHAPDLLTWTERKVELLGELGVDAVVAYPTDEALLHLSAREFFDRIVRQQFGARALVEGQNFFFGRKREGNVELLRTFCGEAGVTLDVVEPVRFEGQIISSSRIRSLLAEGNVGDARRMLTRPYRMRGLVVHGAGRGAKLGYPTANLERIDTLIPAEGIYAGRAAAEGKLWPAAISIGSNPTFNDGRLKIEIHLLDYHGDLYDKTLEVEFLSRLRDVVRFNGVETLLAQMNRDMAATRAMAGEYQSAVQPLES
jgi:riboflavin kinase/FMN adenylyltransferase